jgi:hypothetical protein
LPPEEPVNWSVVVYTTNGITTNGVIITVINTNEVTLGIDETLVQGQVVLSAEYCATNGDLVFASPILVWSAPPAPGATLTNIALQPPSISLNVGDSIPLEILGMYSDGSQFIIYAVPSDVNYISSNQNIAIVDTNGTATLLSAGSAIVQANYGGFKSQATICANTPMSPQMLSMGRTNGAFDFSFLGYANYTNIVQASTNLTIWSNIVTLIPTNVVTSYMDTNAVKFGRRFYRLMTPYVSTNLPVNN